jgi:transcriptional regulator with XRE-family HTH domain
MFVMAATATKTRKRRKVKIRKLTKAERLRELTALVNLCLTMHERTSYKAIAEISGLSMSTISNLAHGRFTLAVRFGTIQALAASVGLRVMMDEYKVRVRLTE